MTTGGGIIVTLSSGWYWIPNIRSRLNALLHSTARFGFWRCLWLFGRPSVNWFALCYRTVVLSVLFCLWCWCIVAKRLDGSRWNLTRRWASTQAIRWGPSSRNERAHTASPTFRPVSTVAKWPPISATVELICLFMNYRGSRWTDLRQIHMEDVFGPSLGRVWMSNAKVNTYKNDIFQPFQRPACVRFVFTKTSFASIVLLLYLMKLIHFPQL